MEALRTWLVPLGAAFMAGALFCSAALLAGPGCQTRCETLAECGPGSFCRDGRCETECTTNADCLEPPECRGNAVGCTPKGLRCNAVGQCIQGPQGGIDLGDGAAPPGDPNPTDTEGWDDRPGTGRAFIVSSLSIAPEGQGADLDGRCRSPGDCIDNRLNRLGEDGNASIAQGVTSGETLLLMELAGLDVDDRGLFRGKDTSLTLKFYGARDADEPPDYRNNFQPEAGSTRCCEFKIDPQSTSGLSTQAKARVPAVITGGRLRALGEVTIEFVLTVGQPPYPEVRLVRTQVSAAIPSSLRKIDDGLLGGAIPIETLAKIDNPYCRVANNLCPLRLPDASLLDLVATLLQPDIDASAPPNGLETVTTGPDGRVSACALASGQRVPAADPARPSTCALDARMQDGYSIGLRFSAVAARVVGLGR